jgi:hypothetical protein
MSINRDDVNELGEKINEVVDKLFLLKGPNQTNRFKARKNAIIIYQFNQYIFAVLVEGNYLDLGFDSFARSSIIHFSSLFGQTSGQESLNKGGSPKTLGVSLTKQASKVVSTMNRRQRRNLQFHREESNS